MGKKTGSEGAAEGLKDPPSGPEEKLSPKQKKLRGAAEDMLERAERELNQLKELGVDVGALLDRLSQAKARFSSADYEDVEMTCSEILVLAKSIGAIAATSLKRPSGQEGRLSEAMKLEIGRLIGNDVSTRIEALTQTLPSIATVEDTVQEKIQEALVTGGLVERLENIANQKAKKAISELPRFTAKDAQAAAKIVVQRNLAQFLSSKKLGERVKSAVQAELSAQLDKLKRTVLKESEALVNTGIASAVAPLATPAAAEKQMKAALKAFLKDGAFEEKVLKLAAERAKAEVQRAPDLMTAAAGKLARQEADALFKTRLRSKEFSDKIKELAQEVLGETVENLPRIGQEDVEIISRRVAEEAVPTLTETDTFKEHVDTITREFFKDAIGGEDFEGRAREVAKKVADEVAEGLKKEIAPALKKRPTHEEMGKITEDLKAAVKEVKEGLKKEAGPALEGLKKEMQSALEGRPTRDEVKETVTEVKRALLTSEDLANWIKQGALQVLREAGLEDGAKGVRKSILGADEFEKFARDQATVAAMDMLESKEFVKRVASVLDERPVKAKLEEVAGKGGGGSPEELDLQLNNAVVGMLESDEFAEKVKELAGEGGNAKEVADRLVQRVEKMEKEALPQMVQKGIQESIGESIDVSSVIKQMLPDIVRDVAISNDFKAMLETKFKTMLNYIQQDVIPKQVKRIMGG